MIRDPQELYARTRRVVAELRRAGEVARAQDLEDAMHISNVGSEVMGELRLELRRLKQSEVTQQLGIADEVDQSLSYLDTVLSKYFG